MSYHLLDSEKQPCPVVNVADEVEYLEHKTDDDGAMEDVVEQLIVKELRYDDLTQGRCKAIKKLRLLYCVYAGHDSDTKIVNPGNTLTVDCCLCPLLV
jgi:hypothetical protein